MTGKLVLIVGLLLGGTAIASAQPGSVTQDRGNDEQSVGRPYHRHMHHRMHYHSHHMRHHQASRHDSGGKDSSRNGEPAAARTQDQRQNESVGKPPDAGSQK